jgi:Tfp pilus assembly PilM family ATPase
MPPDTVVLDYHSLGVVDTAGGPRQRVILVAARRDMLERLLAAVEGAGLRPEGIDLSAFALIRSLHQPGSDPDEPVLYLHLSGLTNLVVARGVSCVFTRVLGTGLEAIATTVAERCVIPIDEARSLVFRVGLASDRPEVSEASVSVAPATVRELTAPPAPATEETEAMAFQAPAPDALSSEEAGVPTVSASGAPAAGPVAEATPGPQSAAGFGSQTAAVNVGASPEPAAGSADVPGTEPGPESPEVSASELERLMTVRSAITDGLRLIVAEVRNSLDYHLGHVSGGSDRPVERVVLSGPAVGIPGLLEALQSELKLPLTAGEVAVSDASAVAGVPASRLAVAAGLAVNEVKP